MTLETIALVALSEASAVLASLTLDGCAGAAPSPDGTLLLVACVGWIVAAPLADVASLALANTLGAAARAPLVPIQVLSVQAGRAAAPFLGMPACALPAEQAGHLASEAGTLQFIGAVRGGRGGALARRALKSARRATRMREPPSPPLRRATMRDGLPYLSMI